MKTNAPFMSIGAQDFIKGLLVAVLTVVLTGFMTSLNAGILPDWPTIKHLLLMGVGAGSAYLIKNLLTNSKDQLLKKEPEEPLK